MSARERTAEQQAAMRERGVKALQLAHAANRKHQDGDLIIKQGRAFIYRARPDKPGRCRYDLLPESTVNWEAAHGRPVKPKHRLIHLDGDLLNNSPDNLRERRFYYLRGIRKSSRIC